MRAIIIIILDASKCRAPNISVILCLLFGMTLFHVFIQAKSMCISTRTQFAQELLFV